MTRTSQQCDDLRRRVAEIGSWYHAMDLGDGVVTPGTFDMASYLHLYRLPERLDGQRVLDVGASNGFFSFEFERRGAAEVVSVDLPSWGAHDWTPRYRERHHAQSEEMQDYIDRQTMRAGFELCREALGCQRVRKEEMAIYDLSPERLGEFDLVFCGSMLMHVRDPILGTQRMRSVCKPNGELIISISTTREDTDEPVARFIGKWNQCNWWLMSPRCLAEVLRCADFDVEEPGTRFEIRDTSGAFVDQHYVCHAKPMRRGG